MRDGAAADAGVDGCGGRGGEVAGEGADDIGVDVAGVGDRLGVKPGEGVGESGDALDVRCGVAEVDEVLVEEGAGDRGEQQRVGAGAYGEVPVGEAGGAGAARVDDGEGAAARLERLELPGKSGAVHRLPLDSSGLAPISSRWSVRSRSGTGMRLASPKRSPLETCLGIWSTVEAVNRLWVPRPPTRSGG